jgi:hypothetical protein
MEMPAGKNTINVPVFLRFNQIGNNVWGSIVSLELEGENDVSPSSAGFELSISPLINGYLKRKKLTIYEEDGEDMQTYVMKVLKNGSIKTKVDFDDAKTQTIVFLPCNEEDCLSGIYIGSDTSSTSPPSKINNIAVGMVLAALTVFRRFFNRESRFGKFLSQQSYAVYIIHSPIIVVLAYSLYRAYALGGIDLGPLLKFGIAAVIAVPTSFAVSYVIRKIPGVSRIL